LSGRPAFAKERRDARIDLGLIYPTLLHDVQDLPVPTGQVAERCFQSLIDETIYKLEPESDWPSIRRDCHTASDQDNSRSVAKDISTRPGDGETSLRH
jgi:hypothetical protein